MKRYPRSFLQLVTFGHILVAMPLLVVTVYVFLTLDTLATHYQAAVENVSESSRLSSDLAEDLLHMERYLRRYEILKDSESLDDYTDARAEWQVNVNAFTQMSHLPEVLTQELKAQLALEETAYIALRDKNNVETLRSVIDEIKLRSQKVREDVRGIFEAEQVQFQAESDNLRKRLLGAVGVAIFIALASMWLTQRLLSRLIGHFERAVLRLGKGDLQQPITLDGPRDLRWLGRWLEWLRRRLASLEEARAQVLRHVSHELKTPLAAMYEGSSLLAEEVAGPLNPEQRRVVAILQNNSRRLQELIEGLLRLQQAGHAAERIGYELLNFQEIIEQVVDTYRLIATERQIEFKVELAAVDIVAGREALLTIMHNLLSNAVKYSPDSSTICVQLSKNDEQAIVDVRDQGPGIPAVDAAQIFEPFYRGAGMRQVAGVGLGLAIAREFVLAHRGELQLLDSPEGGAHFRVSLPLKAAYLRTQKHD